MNFDLHKPCPACPFLRQSEIMHLGRERAREIAANMVSRDGGAFPCHKTTGCDDDTGEVITTEGTQHCAGALLFMEKHKTATQYARVAERVGVYDHTKYRGAELVFDTVREMSKSHGR